MGERTDLEPHPAKPETRSAHHEAQHGPAPAGPHAQQVDNLIAPTSLGAPAKIDVGDREIGADHFDSFQIFNLDQGREANVSIRLEGHPAFELLGHPQRLRPSREGFSADNDIKLRFTPPSKAVFATLANVDVAWQNGSTQPGQHLRIPIIGLGHKRGTPDWAQEAEAREARKHADAEALAEQQRKERLAHAEEALIDAPSAKLGGDKMDRVLDSTRNAINKLFAYRRSGVARAKEMASGYERIPPAHELTLMDVVRAGLDIASLFIAGRVAKDVELTLLDVAAKDARPKTFSMLGKAIHRIDVFGPEEPPSKLMAAGVANVFKEGVKNVGAAVKSAIPMNGTKDDKGYDNQSLFAAEDTALIGSNYEAHELTGQLYTLLHPLLLTNHRLAITMMDAVRAAIDGHADVALAEQREQSLKDLVSYVAAMSVGLNHQHSPLTVPDAFTGEPKARFDGLVDIQFAAPIDPEAKVRVASATLNGVTDQVVEAFRHKPLIHERILVRAIGAPTLNTASMAVTVVRHESGAIEYIDETKPSWMSSNWLRRKGFGDPHEGARKVLEEILSQPLGNGLKSDARPK